MSEQAQSFEKIKKQLEWFGIELKVQVEGTRFILDCKKFKDLNQSQKEKLANLLEIPIHQIAFRPTEIHEETRLAYFDYSSEPLLQTILQTTSSPELQNQLDDYLSTSSDFPLISPHPAQNPHLSTQIIQQAVEGYRAVSRESKDGQEKWKINTLGKLFTLPNINPNLQTALLDACFELNTLGEIKDAVLKWKADSNDHKNPMTFVTVLDKEIARRELFRLDNLRREGLDGERIGHENILQDIENANLSPDDIELLAQQFSFRHEYTKYSVRVWNRILKDPNTPDKVFRQFEQEFFTADPSIVKVFISYSNSAIFNNPKISKEFFAKIDWSFIDKMSLTGEVGLYLLVTDPNIPPAVQQNIATRLLPQLDNLIIHNEETILEKIFYSPNTSSEVLTIIFTGVYNESQQKILRLLEASPNLYIDIATKTINEVRTGKVLADVSGQPIASRSNLRDFIEGSGDEFLPKLKVLLKNAPEPSTEYTNFIAGFDFSKIEMDNECLELLDKVLFEKGTSPQKDLLNTFLGGNLIHTLCNLDLDHYHQINSTIITKWLGWLSDYHTGLYKRWSDTSASGVSLPEIDKNILKFHRLPQKFVDDYSNNILVANFQAHPQLAIELFPIIFENPCFAHLRGHLVNVYTKSPKFSPLKMTYKMTVNQAVDEQTEVKNGISIRTIYQLPKDFSQELSNNHNLDTSNLKLLPYCPWQIQKDVQKGVDPDLLKTQKYLQVQQMMQNPQNKRYLQRFALEYFIKSGEVQPELLLRAEKYFPVFQEILDITDVATADNRHSALARFNHNESVNQGVAQYLNPINPKGLPQLIARCQEFVATDSSNAWNNTKNGLEVLTAELFANLELQITQEEPRELRLIFRNISQGMFTGLQINKLSQKIKLKIEKQNVGKTEIFTLSIPLEYYANKDMTGFSLAGKITQQDRTNYSNFILEPYFKNIQTLLENTIKTLTSAKLAKMPDYTKTLAERTVEEIRERDRQIEQAYHQRIAEIQAQMEKYGSQIALSIIDGEEYDKKLNGEIDLPEPSELETQLLASFEKRLGAVSDSFEFNSKLDMYVEKLIEQFKDNKVSYARRGPIELIKKVWVTKLSESLEKAVATTGDQAQVNDAEKDKQVKNLIIKCINGFVIIKPQLDKLRNQINQNPLSATALEYMDLCIEESNREWTNIVTHTKNCFTISSKLINKDYESTDPTKNKGYMYDFQGNSQETPGLMCMLSRFERGLLELLTKLPPDTEFDDLHQKLLEKYIQTITLISYLASLKFGG